MNALTLPAQPQPQGIIGRRLRLRDRMLYCKCEAYDSDYFF